MPEQVFKSPGFYDREIDLSARVVAPSGTPAGIGGAAIKGPAFVPVTVGSFSDFIVKFGDLSPKLAAPYAAQKWLDNRFSLTYIRILGAGSNTTATDFQNTLIRGTVKNAGFALTGSVVTPPSGGVDARYNGVAQFIIAKHVVTGTEVYGFPMFSDNDSFFTNATASASGTVNLVRGVIFPASDTRIMVMSASDTFSSVMDDAASIDLGTSSPTYKKFKLIISSSVGASFANSDGYAGVKILTASLNPTDANYIGKILNTDPDKFSEQKHLYYSDFAVDDELATISTAVDSILVVSGTTNTSTTSGNTGLTFRDAFGSLNTRYTTPTTPMIISQPFGLAEYDLFRVEPLDDGAYANSKYKISIANVRASTDPRNEYGTFALLIRTFDDNDINPKILEQYNNLTLDPNSDNYIGRIIGDVKVAYSFDVLAIDDRRLVKSGKYPNRSKYVRVVMTTDVDSGLTPKKCLPFGFHGPKLLNTNTALTDISSSTGTIRLSASGSGFDAKVLGAIIPPIPYRFKVTRGPVSASSIFEGYPGPTEVVDSRLYWGVKFERGTNINNSNVLDQNIVTEPNALIASLTKFAGIDKLDVLVTGSKTDTFNNNKFTLARVALSNTTMTDVTASATAHMRETAYIRNGSPDGSTYQIADSIGNRITFASLLQSGSDSSVFNRFADYMKFSMVMYGGWDGSNILDKEASRFTDKATSTEILGGAAASYVSPGFTGNQAGVGIDNNAVFSYQTATRILTDSVASNINILALPGIREPFVTDDAAQKCRDYGLALYLMDIPYYDYLGNRIFDSDIGRFVDIGQTANNFETRAVDNNHAAAYFPNVVIDDTTNNRRVQVPASVAALAALGYNDKVSYPWFAPAGFNRGALDFVVLTQARVNQPERDRMYQTRINPIIRFPGQSYVIFAQKTLQQQVSALDSINVKRMILEVKRVAIDIGNKILFDQITQATRDRLVNNLSALLANVQVKQGIELFKVVSDNTNNTFADEDANRVNCVIRLVPTRAIEIIAIDFIITNSGVQFA